MSVSYDVEVLDVLPHESKQYTGQREAQLERIIHNPDHHAPKWVRIGRYENSSSASYAKSTLVRRHGDSPEVEGFRFATRRIDGGEATGLFAQYDSSKIVPGKREENKAKYAEYQDRQREAAAQARERKAKEEAAHARKVTAVK